MHSFAGSRFSRIKRAAEASRICCTARTCNRWSIMLKRIAILGLVIVASLTCIIGFSYGAITNNSATGPSSVQADMIFTPKDEPVRNIQLEPVASPPATPVTHTTHVVRPKPAVRDHHVLNGDTLSSIAKKMYGKPYWTVIYWANTARVRNPDSIYIGENLVIPPLPKVIPAAPKSYKPYKPPAPASPTHLVSVVPSGQQQASAPVTVSPGTSSGGTLSCSGLEGLWDSAGGNPTYAFIAAEIAMAESGGRQFAHSPTNDFGYWQINGSNGALATYDAYGNARSAIILSHNGTNWSAWTTYTSGAYAGRC